MSSKVAVQDGVVRRDAVSQGEQADDVLEQAAEIGMMQLFGGGRFAEGGGNLQIAEDIAGEQLEMRVGEGVDEAEETLPELLHIVRGGRHQVSLFHFRRQGLAQLLDLHLQAVVEARHVAARLDDVAAIEVFRDACIVDVPDAAFELAGLVAKHDVEVGLVGLGGPELAMKNKKVGIEDTRFFKRSELRDKDFLHAAGRITGRRSGAQFAVHDAASRNELYADRAGILDP